MRVVCHCLCLVLAVLVSSVQADTKVAVALPGLEDFPNARVLFDQRQKEADYTLALGLFRRSGNQWVTERERRLRGTVIRKTLELESGYRPREGYEFYLEQLAPFKPRQLFNCTERDCGSSSRWANQHFNVIQLHGLDQYQRYGVYELTVDEHTTYYVTLYAIQRGNRRVYVQVDLVKPVVRERAAIPSSPEALALHLREQGYFLFPGFSVAGAGEDSDIGLAPVHVESLVQLLKQEPEWRVALVGHDYAGNSLQDQQRYALRYARHLMKALTEKGIAPERLEVFGLGGLAPAGRGERSARIEVVLLLTQE